MPYSIRLTKKKKGIDMKSPARIGKLSAIFDPIYSEKDSGILDFKMFLDGKWISLGQRIDVHSPIDNSVIATVPSSSEKEAEQAVDSSYNNWNAIRTIPAVEKLEIFRTHAICFLRVSNHSQLSLFTKQVNPGRMLKAKSKQLLNV